jgi:hypothetical protein
MILTTCSASSKPATALPKVTLIRLSLGRSSSINNRSGVNSTRRIRMSDVLLVVRLNVPSAIIMHFELPLNQKIRAQRVIRIFLSLEYDLVVVAGR